MNVTNNHDIDCQYSKEIQTDEYGKVQIENENALSYFWHMKSTDGATRRLWTTNITKPYNCTFTLSDGIVNCQSTIERYVMAPGVIRKPIKVINFKFTTSFYDCTYYRCLLMVQNM